MKIKIYKANIFEIFGKLTDKLEIVENGYIELDVFNRDKCWELCNWYDLRDEKPLELHSTILGVSSDVVFFNPEVEKYHIADSVGWKIADSFEDVKNYFIERVKPILDTNRKETTMSKYRTRYFLGNNNKTYTNHNIVDAIYLYEGIEIDPYDKELIDRYAKILVGTDKEIEPTVENLILYGYKVRAVTEYRDQHNVSILEAKEIVELAIEKYPSLVDKNYSETAAISIALYKAKEKVLKKKKS